MLTVFVHAVLVCVNSRVFNDTQEARIVNGEDAVEGEFPFVVSKEDNYNEHLVLRPNSYTNIMSSLSYGG